MSKNLVVILGPTASGKTNLATRLAFDLNGEIISADSRQVYRNMDIGTGKDLNQYTIEGWRIPYHLIDILQPEDEFNLFTFQKRFYEIFDAILKNRKLPVLVGGTGLYLESVLSGYDLPEAEINEDFRKDLREKSKDELREILYSLKPDLHNKTDLEDAGRLIRAIEIETARHLKNIHPQHKPDVDAVIFGVRWERAVLRKRITRRLDERLKNGMVDEVAHLHSAGLSWQKLESFGLEYRFISFYLQGKMPLDEMRDKLNTAIHQFAKRQETWFRRMERKGIVIHWIQEDNYPVLKESAIKFLR